MTKFDKFNLSSFEGVAKWPNKPQDSAWQGCLRKCGEACQLFNSSPRDTPPHLPPLPHTTSLTIRLLLLLLLVRPLLTYLAHTRDWALLNYEAASSLLRDPSPRRPPHPPHPPPLILTSIPTLPLL